VRLLSDTLFLGELSGALASSLDVEVIVGQLTQLVLRHVADVVVLDAPSSGVGSLARTLVRARGQEIVAAAGSRYGEVENECRLGARVLETGEPELVTDVTPEYFARFASAPACLDLLRAARPRSILTVPMRARGRLLGVLSFLSQTRAYDARDLKLAVDAAGRAATAVDNASLHDALTHAHATLRERVRELQEAQEKIRTLTGLLPVCAWCGLIRDDAKNGTWTRFEQYVEEHSSAEVTHGICPSCADKYGFRRK
jgi:GAF domain-containing protein